ncbi:MAG: VCBS repeat-containing protein [Flavobacterium sp.]|nr:VCBS repeat-containing protein [Flavobacterium sp.]
MKKITILLFCLIFQISKAQNSCTTALPITAGITTISIIDGTNTVTTCATATLAEWYVYTPTANHSVTITSDMQVNICKDTNFNVYTGTCTNLTCYSGDDDSGIIACNNGNANSYLSTKTFDVFAGTTYYIAWDNRWSNSGFDFQLIVSPYVPTPCSTAIPITAGITNVPSITGTNITTTCSSATLANWYSYTPTQNYNVTVTSDLISNICKDTNFSVYIGSCAALTCVASDDNSGIIPCNSGNTNSNLSTQTFTVNAGTTYYIVWDNKWSATGFDFQLIQAAIPPPPVSYIAQNVSSINSSFNLCVVDMNGDHKDDIAGVSANNLRVNYQGTVPNVFTFTDFPITGTSLMPNWSLAAGDYNKDGYNDLILGNGSGATFWKSNSTGTAYSSYTPGQYIFCQRTNFVDINNDGNLDAFSCHDVAPNCYYLNDGNANFTFYQSNTTPGAVNFGTIGGNYATLWFDYDNDGDSDVFISKCSGPPCELHRNDGNGIFTDISAIAGINVTPIQTWSSGIADFDNDGDMDIIITASAGSHKFFRNNLDTTNTTEEAFTNITAGSGWDTNPTTNIDNIAYDFDNDGYVDVLGGGNKIMFNNHGTNTFTPVIYSSGLSVGGVGDLNNDGFLDLLNGNTIKYAVPNGNNWVKVALQGIQSNGNGIGARVEIYGAWGKQIRDIRSGEGFKYMSSLNAHFGIGTATAITQIIVRWPSGIVDTYNNPSINQMLLAVEGATLSINSFTNSGFTIYPNPAKDIITIKSSNDVEFTKAQIFDLNGRIVARPKLNSNTISVQDLNYGNYILLLSDTNGKDYTQKFLKE